MSDKVNTKTCVILFGPPLSGKGTLSYALTKNTAASCLDMGSVLRRELAKNADLSAKLARGELLDNEQVIYFFQKEFTLLHGDNIVIDGFPRTLKQAEYLDTQLSQFRVYIVALEVTLDNVINRAAERVICDSCGRVSSAYDHICVCGVCMWRKRSDDLNEIPRLRYEDYCAYKDDILSFFKKTGTVISMDGALPTEVLCASICNLVSKG